MIDARKDITRIKKSEFLERIKNIYSIINELNINISKSAKLDREILMMIRLDQIQNQNISTQLSEVQVENKQLLNMVHLDRNNGTDMSRSHSNTSCSTMSLVRLQYKYEELLSNQNGLLKILDTRHNEIRKYQTENVRLKQEMENFKFTIRKYEMEFTKLLEQFQISKTKKNRKISKLKEERDTLRLVHNRFVNLLNQHSMERDIILTKQLQNTTNSDKALLIQEVRKNNLLTYENFQLQQRIEYLQSKFNAKKSSKMDVTSTISGTSSNLSR